MAMRPLSDSDAACGGKAVALAHLIDAELPVPDGFVLDREAFEAAAGLIDLAGDLASDPAGDLASHPTGDLADHLTGHPAGDPTGARDVGHALAPPRRGSRRARRRPSSRTPSPSAPQSWGRSRCGHRRR